MRPVDSPGRAAIGNCGRGACTLLALTFEGTPAAPTEGRSVWMLLALTCVDPSATGPPIAAGPLAVTVGEPPATASSLVPGVKGMRDNPPPCSSTAPLVAVPLAAEPPPRCALRAPFTTTLNSRIH